MWDAGAIGGRVELKTDGWAKGVDRVKSDVAGLKRTLTGFGTDLTDAAKKLGMIGAAAQVAFGLMARHAMHIEEAENLFEVSFGNMADDVRAWSESVSDSLAMTAAQIREGAGVFAVMTQSMGLSEQAATSLSKNMTMLAADMASFYNLGHEEALQKLQAGLTGEAEPLKRLGILVNENTVAQWAWAHGVAASGEQLTEQQKVIARYGTIMEQTSKAQGDLLRTADSTTNQLRRMKAQFSEIAGELGANLLPALTTGTQILNIFLEASLDWYEANKKVAEGLFLATAGALAFAGALAGVNLVGITTVSGFVAMATIIGGLIAGIYSLNKYWEEARVAMGYWGIGARVAGAAALRVGEIAMETGQRVKEFMFDLVVDATEGIMKIIKQAQMALSYLPGGLGEAAAVGMGKTQESLDTLANLQASRKADPGKYRDPKIQSAIGWMREAREKLQKEADDMMDSAIEVWNQPASKDAPLIDWLKENVDGVGNLLDTLRGYNYEPVDVEALMQGLASSSDVAEKTAKTAREAATEIDRMADAGERLYLNLDPVAGAVEGIRERLAQLEAAGLLNDQTRGLLGAAVWQELEGVSDATLTAILGRVQEFDGAIVKTITNAKEEAERLKVSLAADDLIAQIQPDTVQIFEEMQRNIELLKEAGRLDDETTNLLAAYTWEDMRALSTEALDELIGMLFAAGGAYAEAAAAVEELRGSQAGLGTELANSAGRLMDLGYKINQVSDTLDSGIGRKIGAVVTSISGVASGIGEAVSAFKTLASSGKASIASTIASVAQLGTGVLGAIGAVMALAEAFGIVGDEAEEVKTGWAKVMDELEGQLDEWADRLTDTIIEFVKTGEFELDKFLQGVAEDILRTTITTMFTQPLMGFIGGSFAKGAAFAGGEVVPFAKGGVATAPMYFPMRGGKTGLLGEAGPEAIMPLRRTNDGALGVRATAAETQVNVIDQRGSGAPPVDVRRRKTADGGEEIRILIRDAIADSIARGELDGLLGLTYGLQRGRA